MNMSFISGNLKLIFTFFIFCVIFLVMQFSLTGCVNDKTSPEEVLYFSLKQDCPQCKGFKLVKSENGTLVECPFCLGLGYVYQDPQGLYKKR
jgi:hypothetical protein